MNKLQRLYQELARGDGAAQLSADELVALARGRSVDAHDAKLDVLAQSATDAALLRLTQAIEPAARELAAGVAAIHTPAVAVASRSFVFGWRWAGVAAGVMALALLLGLPRAPKPDMSASAQHSGATAVVGSVGGDEILQGSFEESAALAAKHVSSDRDDIFVGEFDS